MYNSELSRLYVFADKRFDKIIILARTQCLNIKYSSGAFYIFIKLIVKISYYLRYGLKIERSMIEKLLIGNA